MPEPEERKRIQAMVKHARNAVHQLANDLTVVVGALELKNYDQALKFALRAAANLHSLALILRGIKIPDCDKCPLHALDDDRPDPNA